MSNYLILLWLKRLLVQLDSAAAGGVMLVPLVALARRREATVAPLAEGRSTRSVGRWSRVPGVASAADRWRHQQRRDASGRQAADCQPRRPPDGAPSGMGLAEKSYLFFVVYLCPCGDWSLIFLKATSRLAKFSFRRLLFEAQLGPRCQKQPFITLV